VKVSLAPLFVFSNPSANMPGALRMATPYKTSGIRLVALSLLAVTTSIAALIMHNLSAKLYYNLNLTKLKTAAYVAVNGGARYLPGQPQSAVRFADTYLKNNGVMPSEIEFTGVSSDHSTLRIMLRRKMPLYLTLLAMELPSRWIVVTASAHVGSAGHFLETSFVNGQ
jgi:hypothetical protein